jgi:multiple sugar transport system ATP-binding protein
VASVVFHHVTKRFGETVAVKDLNLEIAEGEFLVFVGPSGCGKTTSLRMLAGLETISSGDLFIGERKVNAIPPKNRDIAMVFQSYALYPHMTVAENMAFALQLQGTPRAEIQHRVQGIARRLEIESLLQRKPRELSGGQQQRVALGRAMMRNPAVFLMDEPLSNLDARLRVQARTEISRLHQQLGKTFVYVTHDQVEAMTMGNRIAVMQQGILQQVASPETLYRYPANRFVAEFIGSPSMNFFQVLVRQEEEQIWLKGKGFKLLLPDTLRTSLQQLDPPSAGEMMLGIRPEDLYDPAFLSHPIDAVPLQARVLRRELLGHEVILHLALVGGEEFLMRVNARTQMQPGNPVELLLDRGRIHLFDPDSQLRIA